MMLSMARSNSPRLAFTDYLVQHRVLLMVLAVQMACATYAYQLVAGLPIGGIGRQLSNLATVLPCAAYVMLAHRLFHLTYIDPQPNRMTILRDESRAFLTDVPTLIRGSVTLFLLLLGMSAFAQTKRLVAALGEFSWDATFAAWDRAVFLGHDPWRVFHDAIGFNWVLTLMTGSYAFWFSVLLTALTLASFTRRNPQARMQFMLAHMLSWFLIGNVMAILLSSAGPAYYERLGLGDAYQPLLALLDAHAKTYPYSVRELQEVLWDLYTFPEGGFSVISAMPSMHVASTLVITLYAFTASRWLGWAMAAFTFTIFIASFMLAWHYFLDGVIAAILVAVIWKFSGWLARRTVSAEA
jgi:PAP2 superfamily